MRLNKFIGDSGHCSRREADRLIAEGRVTVDGVRARVGAELPEGAEVRIDGRPLSARQAAPGKRRLQHGFVVLTVMLACVLLVGAGLFIRSFATLMATDVGFTPGQVLAVSTTLPRTFYATAASVRTSARPTC